MESKGDSFVALLLLGYATRLGSEEAVLGKLLILATETILLIGPIRHDKSR